MKTILRLPSRSRLRIGACLSALAVCLAVGPVAAHAAQASVQSPPTVESHD